MIDKLKGKSKHMEEEKKVALHGMWASPFVTRVKIALKIKGITYEYFEESMKKKSQMLLEYNPIQQKVPVLVHDGNPIGESLIILQYIDETWKGSPQLMPDDPYSRSMVRFWANFILDQLDMPLKKLAASHKKTEEERNIREVQMNLNILEENIKVIFPYDSPSSGEDMKMLDILLSTLSNVIRAIEDAFNLKLMEQEKYPLTCVRMTSLCGINEVKDIAPSHEKLVKFFVAYRRFYANSHLR